MICPKCGFDNKSDEEKCPKCGIFYIRWMIRQFKQKGVKRLQEKRRLWPAALVAGFAAGAAAVILNTPQPIDSETKRPSLSPPLSVIGKQIDPLLEEAVVLAQPYGVRITQADFNAFFTQGFNSFTPSNLREAEKKSGRPRPTRPGTTEELNGSETRPIKCLIRGEWRYFSSPPGAQAEAQECWRSERRLRRKTIWDNPYTDVVWNKLAWSPGKNRWAEFTIKHERYLYREFIRRELGDATERADLEESKAKIRTAGKNKSLMKTALVTAFRTRARRLGATYRLESLKD
jgi:hypothetical protein